VEAPRRYRCHPRRHLGRARIRVGVTVGVRVRVTVRVRGSFGARCRIWIKGRVRISVSVGFGVSATSASFAETRLATARLRRCAILTRGGSGSDEVADDVEGGDGRVTGGRLRQGHHQIEVLADQAGGL